MESVENGQGKKPLWKLKPYSIENKTTENGEKISVRQLMLKSDNEEDVGELKYSVWQSPDAKYLYVWWLEVTEEYQNKIYIVRDFLSKFSDIIKNEKVEKIRWQSDHATYLDSLYGGHGFAHRVVDKNFPIWQLDNGEKKKATTPESFYEASAADMLDLAARLTK